MWAKKLLSSTHIWLIYDCVVNELQYSFFFQEDEDYIAAEEVKVALSFSSCFLYSFSHYTILPGCEFILEEASGKL